ncbi:hypothetical protein CQW23_07009 [Capsicum baccatum]|uniref:Uncharacterized protein n=1 Tax=Capsicum baccatum TaxID=33114 RepID=A0A2G2X501_CAPBA|nr:hypothetical protein CQW23_07009 [Capsicum baccatum]
MEDSTPNTMNLDLNLGPVESPTETPESHERRATTRILRCPKCQEIDPPDEPKEYIHRVGRTTRGEGAKGNALLFLIPEELQFLKYLKAAKVPVKEYEFDQKKLANVQSLLEKLVANNYYLNQSAKEAYRSKN